MEKREKQYTQLGAEEGPLASMVALCAREPGFGGFLLYLSRLAAHTRNLSHDARASLVITQVDSGAGSTNPGACQHSRAGDGIKP